MPERSSSGRFVRRAEPAPAEDPSPEPMTLTIEPVDVPAGELPELELPEPDTDPLGTPELAIGSHDDVALAEAIAKGINIVAGAALGAEYRADDDAIRAVGEKGGPVLSRAAARFGIHDLAADRLPAWVIEVIDLSAAVYVAWGDAMGEAWTTAVAARRAAREDDDAETGSSGRDGGADRRRDRAAGRGGDAAAGHAHDEPPGAPLWPGSGGDAPLAGPDLAAALAVRHSRRSRPS